MATGRSGSKAEKSRARNTQAGDELQENPVLTGCHVLSVEGEPFSSDHQITHKDIEMFHKRGLIE
ncbi:hypothetical protein [Brevibacillus agri]|uniref:hypothetical protein n=1 Tax=Brevibacillus agri TaxID=51101 RepID=UPI0018CEA0DD|nr:hypothetical protein [Brevibacillus agri]